MIMRRIAEIILAVLLSLNGDAFGCLVARVGGDGVISRFCAGPRCGRRKWCFKALSTPARSCVSASTIEVANVKQDLLRGDVTSVA